MSADYSQIELRLAAHMADVPQLKEAFRVGPDIHNITAEELFGSLGSRQPATRPRPSISRSSMAFRRGDLRAGLVCRKKEGSVIIARYFDRFPGIRNYIARDARVRARQRLHPAPCSAAKPTFRTSASRQSKPSRGRRARRRQRADPGHQRRFDQAGDGADGRRACRSRVSTACGCCCRSTTSWCSKCPPAARRTLPR